MFPMLAIVLAASQLVVSPMQPVYDQIKPADIQYPPKRWQSIVGEPHVVYVPDVRLDCFQHKGFITIACTLGKAHDVTVLPVPEAFADEQFARKLAAMPMAQRNGYLKTACKYKAQVYARLVCHEVVGHQLGGWPADHRKGE